MPKVPYEIGDLPDRAAANSADAFFQLSFAVLDAAQNQVAIHVGLRNRDGGRVAIGERGEISYWTAADARLAAGSYRRRYAP